jgi:hypothetical protein
VKPAPSIALTGALDERRSRMTFAPLGLLTDRLGSLPGATGAPDINEALADFQTLVAIGVGLAVTAVIGLWWRRME